MDLQTPLNLRLPKAAATRLAKAGIVTVSDLVHLAPKRYTQWGALTPIGGLVQGEEATVQARVQSADLIANRKGGVRLVVWVTDGTNAMSATFFAKNHWALTHHQRLLHPGAHVFLAGTIGSYRGALQMIAPQFEQVEEGSPEDQARRAGRLIPVYKSVGALPSWKIAALITSVLDDLADDDLPELISQQVRDSNALFGYREALEALHRPESPAHWTKARRTLAWQEALVLQTALLQGRADRGRSHPVRPGRQYLDLTQSLPFSLTKDQKKAVAEILADLEQCVPMQRLVQGDVGSGKTVVALAALLANFDSGGQGVLLAPTEVLARQHFASLSSLLACSGQDANLRLLTSKTNASAKDEVLQALASGQPGIVVGTHALLQQGVDIPNLTLLVVDEQHRFGVDQREVLREGRDAVPHLLVMTATPIPRTIAMTVFADLDVTTIKELPPGRKPVQTHLVDQRNRVWMERMWVRAREEVDAGGRVYVVCPRIDVTDQVDGGDEPPAPELQGGEQAASGTDTAKGPPAALEVVESLRSMEAMRGIEVELAHGRRKTEENAQAFARFASGEAPVLVATTVVEVGVDVPEATMMIILDGTRFGLAQLHQLRGRVGRGSRPSVCMVTHPGELGEVAASRLQALAQTTDGFELAEKDLALRKEGDVLGKSQSGRASGLKFLSVRRDEAIISAARAQAEMILEEDPDLSSRPGLAQAVRERGGEELVWMEKS